MSIIVSIGLDAAVEPDSAFCMGLLQRGGGDSGSGTNAASGVLCEHANIVVRDSIAAVDGAVANFLSGGATARLPMPDTDSGS